MGGPTHVTPPADDSKVDEMDKVDKEVSETETEAPKEEAKVTSTTESVSSPAPTEAEGKE